MSGSREAIFYKSPSSYSLICPSKMKVRVIDVLASGSDNGYAA